MKEMIETTYVVEGHNNVHMESFNFETLEAAQAFIDKTLDERRFLRVDLYKETHTRRRLSSSARAG